MVFQHSLIPKLVKIPVQDISLTGFSVEEEEAENANLIPGLILPEIKIEFPDLSCEMPGPDCLPQASPGGQRSIRFLYLAHFHGGSCQALQSFT